MQRVELRVKQGELVDVTFISSESARPAVIVRDRRVFSFHHTSEPCSEACPTPKPATLIYYEISAVFLSVS